MVARLSRGQYGIFVTTSYFTKQTQEEVLEDRYPTTLVAGADLVRIMRELRIARGAEIRPAWLHAVEVEVAPVVTPIRRAAEEPAQYDA